MQNLPKVINGKKSLVLDSNIIAYRKGKIEKNQHRFKKLSLLSKSFSE